MMRSITPGIVLAALLSFQAYAQQDHDGPPVVVAQTPRQPFPYTQQEVTYAGGSPQVTLAATLYLPAKVKKPPVVVFVPGTGRQDRNSKMGPHPYYYVIVDHLCRNGIAVLWADDRGVGKSTGSYDSATTADFASDVAASVKFLTTQKTVDKKHIGIVGHSEGGTMAIIATAASADVAFMVSLAGVSIDGLKSVIKQNEGIVSHSPISPEEIAAYNNLNSRLFQIIHDHIRDKAVDSLLLQAFAAWKQEQPPALIKKMRFDDYIGDRYIQRFIALPAAPWYKFMITYDPADAIRRINVPVLALNGDRDIMVDAELNLTAYETLLKEHSDYTIRKMAGLNHMFQHCEKCTPQEYTALPETFSPEVLTLVTDWISQHTKK
jgi:dienelactone hydrolase